MRRIIFRQRSEPTPPGLSNLDPGEMVIDPIALGQLVWSRRRLIAFAVMSVTLLTLVIVLLLPNQYRSTATILPSGATDKMAELKQLAGLGNLVVSDQNSSELYPTILSSKFVSDAVLAREYDITADGAQKRIRLSDYLDQDNPDKLRLALAGITTIANDKKTGVITLSVETKYPELSQGIARQYLQALDSFNLHQRRSKAAESADYLEKQLAAKTTELTQAEDALAAFQERNRDWATSTDPEVLKRLAELKREAEVKNSEYLFLNQQYEMAKFETQKDIPVVRLLDPPTLPTRKASPQRLLILTVMFVLSMLLSIGTVIVIELIRQWLALSAGLETPSDENNADLPTAVTRRRRTPAGTF